MESIDSGMESESDGCARRYLGGLGMVLRQVKRMRASNSRRGRLRRQRMVKRGVRTTWTRTMERRRARIGKVPADFERVWERKVR
ncbi:hypothetical protein PIB30_060318 [Stylosanthes scabra]|uniref:Uncharacterized protein n=1 Tax=Stylosanthes scabra TaxID=79078 RepID=A0ABU6UP41_9FABA|nr:hypothetical protein [Stylosanthes scabra]